MNPVLAFAGLYGAGAYVLDVMERPDRAFQQARVAADRRARPLLNIGAGTPGSSLRSAIEARPLPGDVNLDISGSGPHGPRTVSYGDVQDLSDWPDGHFGAAVASHVLEHVEDPMAAAAELRRVTDGPVYVLSPRSWAPHTWLHPGHRYAIAADGRLSALYGQPGSAVGDRLRSMYGGSYGEQTQFMRAEASVDDGWALGLLGLLAIAAAR